MNQEEQWLLSEKFGGEKYGAFFADLELLKSGTPLAYLIGSIPFLGCTIHLDSHPLIPRSETEFWTEKAISTIKKHPPRGLTPGGTEATEVRGSTPYFRVLDLCAGSGAIGIAVAKTIPDVEVDFTEINPSHLPTIQKNVEHNLAEYSNRLEYSVLESDLFENISEGSKYDYILTNPPYIDPSIDRVEESVKLHEPHLALYGGTEGMECIHKIIEQAPAHLIKHGQLWIEHEPEQSESIAVQAKVHNFSCTTHKDQYQVERYSILVLE